MRCICLCLLACSISPPVAYAQKTTQQPEGKKPKADEKTIRALIRQLGDDAYDVREKAQKRLAAIGEPALPLIRGAAKSTADAEVKSRLEELQQTITGSYFVQVRTFGKHDNWVTRLAVTPDGRELVAALRSGSLGSWSLADGKQGAAFDWPGRIGSWAFSLSADGKRLIVGSEDRVARVFDMKTHKLVQELRGHTAEVTGAAFLPGGKRAITGGRDLTLRIWDLETGKELRAFERVPEAVFCLDLAPDGKLAAVGHTSGFEVPGTIRLWDVKSGKITRTLEGHTKRLCSVRFSPDGKMLVSSSFDGTVRLWDTATGTLRKTLRGHTDHVESAVFSVDGKKVVSVGNQSNPVIMIWDVATGAVVHQTAPIGAGFLDVIALPGGKRYLTSGKDGIVRLWEWRK